MLIVMLKILYGAGFGALGLAAWGRVSTTAGDVNLLWLVFACFVGGVASLGCGWLLSGFGDPFVSASLGAMLGGFLGGMATGYLRPRNRQ